MTYRLYQNLEYSLQDFLTSKLLSENILSDSGTTINVRAGRVNDNSWTLPCIAVYMESETLARMEIGSNKRLEVQLLIIEIYATNENERLSLAKWVVDTINDGWRYYTYSYNSLNPEAPIKTAGDWINVNFITNTRVSLGQNRDLFDAHRHRISINTWMT